MRRIRRVRSADATALPAQRAAGDRRRRHRRGAGGLRRRAARGGRDGAAPAARPAGRARDALPATAGACAAAGAAPRTHRAPAARRHGMGDPAGHHPQRRREAARDGVGRRPRQRAGRVAGRRGDRALAATGGQPAGGAARQRARDARLRAHAPRAGRPQPCLPGRGGLPPADASHGGGDRGDGASVRGRVVARPARVVGLLRRTHRTGPRLPRSDRDQGQRPDGARRGACDRRGGERRPHPRASS